MVTATFDRPLTESQERLVSENLGLIGWTIGKKCRGLLSELFDYDDAWQEGYLGLVEAARRFDPLKAKFSTYAPVWIRSAIQRGRGRIEGVDYRRAAGRAGFYVRRDDVPTVLSLDLAMEGGDTLLDLVSSDEDTAESAITRSQIASIIELKDSVCNDGFDQAIFLNLVRHDRVTLEGLSVQFGTSTTAVSARQKRIIARLRSQLGAA